MPTSAADRIILATCFWLMSFGLRLIHLGNRLSDPHPAPRRRFH